MGAFDLSPATHDVTIGDTKLRTRPYTLALREELADLRSAREDLRNKLYGVQATIERGTEPGKLTKQLEQLDALNREIGQNNQDLALRLIVDTDGEPIDTEVLEGVSPSALARFVAGVLGDAEADPTEQGQDKS